MVDSDKKAYEDARRVYEKAIKVHEEAQAAYAKAGKAERDKAEEAFAVAYATFAEAKRIFATGGTVSAVSAGHPMKQAKTTLEVQGYAPDWPALEAHFPEIKGMPSYKEKWAYIEERCQKSEEDAKFVKEHRPKIDNSHRLVKDKVVTDDFAEDIVDALIAETWTPLYKYHHSGTGTNAENATDSALQTPVEDDRDVGSHEEGATTKTYKSIATTTYTGTHAIIEHGLFKTAGAGGPPVTGGILMDRTKLGASIGVVSGNQIEWTFQIAFTSGS